MVQHGSQHCLAFLQGFFCPLALGDIVNHSYGAEDLTILIPKMFAFFVDDADLAASALDDAVLNLVSISTIPKGLRIGFIHRNTIVWMYRFEEGFIGSAKLLGLQSKDAVDLVGPG